MLFDNLQREKVSKREGCLCFFSVPPIEVLLYFILPQWFARDSMPQLRYEDDCGVRGIVRLSLAYQGYARACGPFGPGGRLT
jgi:hypothetical protein